MSDIVEFKLYEGYGADEEGNIYCRRSWRPIHNERGVITGQTIFLSDKWRKLKNSKYKINKNGNRQYSQVSLSINSVVQTKKVHKLIALAFIPNPNNFSFVCHKDGNPDNNKVENLYWGTPKQNQADRIKHGTMCYGEQNSLAKLNNNTVIILRKIYATNKFSKTDLAEIAGVSLSSLSKMLTFQTWTHLDE